MKKPKIHSDRLLWTKAFSRFLPVTGIRTSNVHCLLGPLYSQSSQAACFQFLCASTSVNVPSGFLYSRVIICVVLTNRKLKSLLGA